jgi:endonuclease/exonuclease/phosphatase family metal-dependent hydrolase
LSGAGADQPADDCGTDRLVPDKRQQEGRLEQRRPPRDSVAIASMNLHCGVGSQGEPYDVEAAICELDAPIVAVQECWTDGVTPDPVAAAAKALGAELLRAPLRSGASLPGLGIPLDSGPGQISIAVLSALPVVRYEVIDLGRVRGDLTPRRAQVVTVELPGGAPLRLACTHLTYRFLSPVQLARLLQHLSRPAVPTVIVGDLNMPRQVARIAPGYAAAVRGRTWPAELPLVQLDHVLINNRLERVDGQVLPAAGSDHLPVRARIRLRAR